MNMLLLGLVLLALPISAFAEPVEFRFYQLGGGESYKCLNSKQEEGLNLNYFGECGQVTDLDFLYPLAQNSNFGGLQAASASFWSGDFSRSRASFANFSKAFFDAPRFDFMRIFKSNFSDVKASGASLDFLEVSDSNFQRIFAYRSAGFQVRFQNVDASNSNFSFTFLQKLSCFECNFQSASLHNASIRDALVSFSNFSKADLGAINLSGSLIKATNLEGAELSLAILDSTSLSSVSFMGTHMVGTNLIGARIVDCNFENADLRTANFSAATISGKNRWQGARFSGSTKLPFSESRALQEGMVKVSEPSAID